MALRNQPYFPLYVQDFLTDEKLAECSAESTGVYIRLMCILHKSEEYGCILLKQKDKQTSSTIKNFAYKLVRQMPYDVETIERSITELVEERVLTLEEDLLYQKRMRKDGILSDKRAEAGKKGGMKKNSKDFAIANSEANDEANTLATTEYEYENETEDEIIIDKKSNNKDQAILETIKEIIDYLNIRTNSHYKHSTDKTKSLIKARLKDGYKVDDFKLVIDKKYEEWVGTDMERYLRPETLFGNKFESYFNQKISSESKNMKKSDKQMEILKGVYNGTIKID